MKAMTKADYLELLEGHEVLSFDHEQCVAVHDGKIVGPGLVVLVGRPTLKQMEDLFAEAFFGEFGHWPPSMMGEEIGDAGGQDA